MNYEEILKTVRGFCAREKLLDGKKHLALAVSGGADSMALLCLMRPLAGEKGIALTVCPGWVCRCGCSIPLRWKPRQESPGRGRTGRAACGMPALSGCWPTG